MPTKKKSLSKKHQFVLFALYRYLQEANKRFKKAPLSVSVSKSIFIDFLKKQKLADKTERALYKNLEFLEKKKLIKYENRFLKPTKKGLKIYQTLLKEIAPYIHLLKTIKGDVTKMTKRAQAFFKTETKK